MITIFNPVSFKTPSTQRGEFQLINGGDFRVIIDSIQLQDGVGRHRRARRSERIRTRERHCLSHLLLLRPRPREALNVAYQLLDRVPSGRNEREQD